MRSSTSPQIRSGEPNKRIERVIDRALGGVLHRHDAEIREPRLHLVEHLVHRGQRQRAHRVAEVLERGGLRERALGPEVTRP